MTGVLIFFGMILGVPMLYPIMLIDHYLLGGTIPWPRTSGESSLLFAIVGWVAWVIIVGVLLVR